MQLLVVLYLHLLRRKIKIMSETITLTRNKKFAEENLLLKVNQN